MEYNRIEIPCKYSRIENFTVVPIGDIHEGNIGCCEKTLQEEVEWVQKHNNVFWIGMGDYIEAINYSDPRFDIKSVSRKYRDTGNIDMMVQLQIENISKIFEPIKDKCLGLHRGNHEETIRKFYHYDVIYELWKRLKVRPLYDVAITRLQFTAKEKSTWTNSFDIFSTHGNVGGRKSGGKVNRLEDLMAGFESDVYLMGHAHIKAVTTTNRLYIDQAGNLKSKKKIGAITGSFLRGYNLQETSYVEKGTYPASDLGTIKILINPRKDEMNVNL